MSPRTAAIFLSALAVIAAPVAARPVDNWSEVNARLFAGPTQDPRILAERAYVWGMPLVEAALIRDRFAAQGPLNRFHHLRKLAGPEMHAGVGPNNDTIYALAWVDVSEGPLILIAPDFGTRYYTFSINQADSSAQQSLGQRTHGGQLPPLFIHAVTDLTPVPAGMVDVPISMRYANIAGRILVRGQEEYPQVNALQDRIRLIRWGDFRAGHMVDAPAPSQPPQPITPSDKGLDADRMFLAQLGHVLKDWPASSADAPLIASFADLGLTPGSDTVSLRSSPAVTEDIHAGLEAGRQLVKQRSLHLGRQSHGWSTNYQGPRFGTDFLLRAGVAKDQIYVALPEEALYPVARIDADGRSLDGHWRYRIHFRAGDVPPVDAFWSITAYDNAGFMVPNPINRYSIGDRTPGLLRDADGGLTITLANNKPGANNGANPNWLPVPHAPFYLMMRLYRPRSAALTQFWRPPAIEKTGLD